MLFSSKKLISSISRRIRETKNPAKASQLCPRTGKRLWLNRKNRWLIWLFPIAGLFSLIWFLIRVMPKPSRATYPCQRLAMPLASSFVVWILGLVGSTLIYRRARHFLRRSQYVIAAIFVAAAVMTVWFSLSITAEDSATAAFTPTDSPNSPFGTAKGIYPGRVVWTHEPAATGWDGSTGDWWDDDNTDQEIVDYMVSRTIQTLTGQVNDANAWDALFRNFNQVRGLDEAGYLQGEKIAIKINMNQNTSGFNWSKGQGMPSPHVIASILDQLINTAGVPGSAITIYDASRYIGNPVYDKIRNNPDPNFQDVTFVSQGGNGRIAATRDTGNPLYTKAGTAYLPRCVTGAKYLINTALLRPHSLYGITLTAKNHFGSTYFPSQNNWTPSPMHNYGLRGNSMGSYNCLVELNGHRHLGGKTLLYMIDGLYGARNQSSNVLKWISFGDNWCSSIFASQDQVAIDSVGLDFLRYEDEINPDMTDVTGNPENYLHEAALADNPPSGTFYDPEQDGIPLTSLGVHEHWNNPVDKQYSRNLGTGKGVELVRPSFATENGPIENVNNGKRYDHFRHAVMDAEPGDLIVAEPGIYYENVNLEGKDLTLSSTNPDDPVIVASTIISGGRQAVTFSSGEDANSTLTGFTITGAETGIFCSGSSPLILNCRIIENIGTGIELHNGSNPTIGHCEITCNSGAGIHMFVHRDGRKVTYNRPVINNCIIAANRLHGISDGIPEITKCTIAANGLCGISGGVPAVTNSIIYYNNPDSDFIQIESDSATVSYSDIQGNWPGQHNIDEVPGFAELGYWDINNTPDEPDDDSWFAGDYHLLSQAGRWDPNSQNWIQDTATSPCIDTGNPASDWSLEPLPNGGRINLGAFGGTQHASMSLPDTDNNNSP